MPNVTQHIERYQVSEEWTFSYGDAKSKYLKIMSQSNQNLMTRYAKFTLWWWWGVPRGVGMKEHRITNIKHAGLLI